VGDELFDQFAADYLRAHPPAATRWEGYRTTWSNIWTPRGPTDWARLSLNWRAWSRQSIAFSMRRVRKDCPHWRCRPARASLSRWHFVPGFELLAFEFPVSTYYTDWKAGRQPSWPGQRSQFVALFRRDYVVRRHELSAQQHDFGC
jgi:hypothetical protein